MIIMIIVIKSTYKPHPSNMLFFIQNRCRKRLQYNCVRYYEVAARRDKILGTIKCLYSELKELLTATRTSVHINRMKSDNVARDFKKARADLREASGELQSIRGELQSLYIRKTNEYLKPRELQAIREINEEENVMIDGERAVLMRLQEIQNREESLFESFRSSNDTLYQSTQRYANKFIAFGAVVGVVWGTWRFMTFIAAPATDVAVNSDSATVHYDDALLQVVLSRQVEQLRDLDDLKTKSKLHETSFEEINANLDNLLYGAIVISVLVLSICLFK